ncbi:MAG: tRNA (guanine-N1)-methyltransferase [Saccharolobus sp.]
MILGRILGKYLRNELGIESLKIVNLKKFYKTSYLQSIGINMILYNYGITKSQDYGKIIAEEEDIKILKSRGETSTNYVIVKNGDIKIREDIIPLEPNFIIDLGFLDIQLDEEKISLKQQIMLSLATIRGYLSDYNLKLAHAPPSLKLEGKNKVSIIDSIPKDNAIVLNPYGDIIANEEIIRTSKVFILGGIVDKGRRLKNATFQLAKKYGYEDLPQVKIALRNSTLGVPDRINKIIEILLKTISGVKLEDAIISSQTNADKLNRLVNEINLLEDFNLERIRELKEWLKVNDKIVKIAIRRSKFKSLINNINIGI